jgi:dTDP-glucose pyrophosphorylase
MLLLITAAGEGSRFRREGLTVPKPLIRVHGRTLLEHTLASFQLHPGDQVLIAVQRDHGVRERLDGTLPLAAHWIELEALLPGQLATAVHALEQLNTTADLAEHPLLIHNCDTGFRWQADLLPDATAYGSMAVFEAEGDHWSFGKPDPTDPSRAIAIAEKQRISDLASIGLYGFRSLGRFLHDARIQLQSSNTVRGEHYVAPLLNTALERGDAVQLPRVSGVRLYGTPAELCSSFGISLDQLLAENG